MDNIVVFETADHLHDGVGFAYVREEFVTESRAFRSARDKPCDIDELDGGRNEFLRVGDL